MAMMCFFVVEFDSVDVLENFFQVRLHCGGFFGLTQDFKQFVITQKIEPSEPLSFLFQIFIERFLDQFKLIIGFFELIK